MIINSEAASYDDLFLNDIKHLNDFLPLVYVTFICQTKCLRHDGVKQRRNTKVKNVVNLSTRS